VLEWLSLYRDSEDLISIGAYQKGSNPKLDEAIGRMDRIQEFLKQDLNEEAALQDTLNKLENLTA
jgi:flagellum-specific ATP synthase